MLCKQILSSVFIFCKHYMCVMWLHVCTLRSRIFYYQCIMYAAKLNTWYVGYCQQLLAMPMSKRVERMFSRSRVSRSIDRSQEFFSRIKNENMSSISDFMHCTSKKGRSCMQKIYMQLHIIILKQVKYIIEIA